MNKEQLGKHTIQCFRFASNTHVFLIWDVRRRETEITQFFHLDLIL